MIYGSEDPEENAKDAKGRVEAETERRVFDPICKRLGILPIELLRVPTCEIVDHINADPSNPPIRDPDIVPAVVVRYISQFEVEN